MTNKTYIYHDDKSDAITKTKDRTTMSNGINTRFYYYDTTPNTELTGIHLSVQNTSKVALYQGEDTMEQPITEIPTDIETADDANIFLTFEANTFGNNDTDRLLIGLTQDGATVPSIDNIHLYGTMIAFPDGFFEPNRSQHDKTAVQT